jgi:hypothetical protein
MDGMAAATFGIADIGDAHLMGITTGTAAIGASDHADAFLSGGIGADQPEFS